MMKWFLIGLLASILVACSAPKPTTPSFTPSAAPLVAPALIPSTVPSPIPSAIEPTTEPTRAQAPSTAEVLLPILEKTVELGPADLDSLLSTHSLALDEQADRLYVSLAPSRTIVLDANTLTAVGEVPSGGALSVNPAAQRLYIGVPGSYAYNPDGTRVITPAELKLFDTSNLSLLRSLSTTSTVPPLVAVDSAHNKAYVIQDGVTLMDATTLDAQGPLSGTFPLPDVSGPNYSAVEAALLPQRQRLFVSLNNNIPGSNNGNILAVYDLVTGQMITQNLELSVDGFAVDETTETVFAPYSRPIAAATVKYDAQGRALKRLAGNSGVLSIDPAHDRVYSAQWDTALQLKVFDRDLNFLGVAYFPEIVAPQAVLFDPKHDRLLVLRHDGRLSALKGQGQPLGAMTNAPVPERKALESLFPSPQFSADQTLFALFAPDEYVGSQGTLFSSHDAGATWQPVTSLPAGMVNDLQFADQLLFAAAGGDGTDDGYGIWRSNDQGQSWQPTAQGLTDLSVTRLAVSPNFAQDGTLYALSRRGVFRSTDRGATWTSLAERYAPLLKDLTVSFSSIAVSPHFAQDNTLLIGHTSGLWRSTERGATWTNIDNGPRATRLAYAPDGSIVFAANDDGVQRSTDGGLTWQSFNAGLDLTTSGVADVQTNDREAVVLMTGYGQPSAAYRLPLTETTWQRAPFKSEITAMALTPADQLLIGTAQGSVQHGE